MLKGIKCSEVIDERESQKRKNRKKIDKFLKEHENVAFVLGDIARELNIPFGVDGILFDIIDLRSLLSDLGDGLTFGLTKRTRYYKGYVAHCRYWDWKIKR